VKLDNEDYGRGYVEEYLGDLISLEELTKAIVQGSVAASKLLFLVKPGATTKQKTLQAAKNCDIVAGNAEDVSTLQAEKFADFKVTLDTINMITERLSFAFLLNVAVQRQAERVTATEVSYVARELEDGLGGVYSILSQELQTPLVSLILNDLMNARVIPMLPKGMVTPMIVTGIEALGRGKEQEKLDAFMQHLQPLGEETLRMYMNIDDYIKRCATNYGIDQTGLIKSKEEIQAEQDRQMQMQQQAMMQQTMLQKGPDYMRAVKETVVDPMAEQPQ